jgi:regulator of protease activity HflC (stomatin/prohibitin superfamily)
MYEAMQPTQPRRPRGTPPPWALRGIRSRRVRRGTTLVLALVGLALVVAVSGARFARQPIGYVGVVRNGGPLDTRTIRQVLMPGERLTWIGFFSETPHQYPASNVNRTYQVTGETKRGSRPGVDVVKVPTKDGVLVGIEATVFLRFVGEADLDTLYRFETSYGTRRFPTPKGQLLYPWQGDEGFFAWLDFYFRPVLDYNLRQEIASYTCAEIVASCSLVTRGANSGNEIALRPTDEIAADISRDLEHDLEATLGQAYLRNIRMRIARVTLPEQVQSEINKTQAAYAAINRAKAELQQAKFQSEGKRLLGKAYNESPALANIDALKSLPDKATVILNSGQQGKNSSGTRPLVVAGD